MKKFFLVSLLSLSIALPSFASSQEVQELRSEVSELKAEVRELKSLLHTLVKENSIASSPSTTPPTPPVVAVRSAAPQKQYLPDIGVIADLVGTFSESKEDEEGNDRFAAREVSV